MYWRIPSGGGIYNSSRFQWAPTRTSHDPNPPITIETLEVPVVAISDPWCRIKQGIVAIEGAGLGGVIME